MPIKDMYLKIKGAPALRIRKKAILFILLAFILTSMNFTLLTETSHAATTLNPPTDFKAEIYGYYIQLSWVTQESSYTYALVERSTDNGGFIPLTTIYSGVASFRDYAVINGHSYKYRVKVFSLNDSSAYTKELELLYIYPSELTFSTPYQGQVDLNWAYPTFSTNSTMTYQTRIERRLMGETNWIHVATVSSTQTNYRDSGLDPDAYYFYRIRALRSDGSSSPWYPHEIGLTTKTNVPLSTSLSGYAVSDDQIKLEWDRLPTNLSGSSIAIEKRNAVGNYEIIYTSYGDNDTSYIDKNLTKGTTYYYRLYVQSRYGNSSERTEAIGIATETLPAPSGISATLAGERIVLNWSYPYTVESGFEIWRKASGVGVYEKIAVVPRNTETYADLSVENGQTYTYRVRAYRGTSAFSAFNTANAVINAKPDAPGPIVFYTADSVLFLYSSEDVPAGMTYTMEYRTDINQPWISYKSSTGSYLNAHYLFNSYTQAEFRIKSDNSGLFTYSPVFSFYGALPDRVQSLTAPYVGSARVLLTWTNRTQKNDGFRIYRTVDGVRKLLGTEAKNATSYTDSSAPTGKTVLYEVVPYNIVGEAYSTAITVAVPQKAAYTDIQNYSWSWEAINTLSQRGPLPGAGATLFNPSGTMRRDEFIRLVLSSFSIPYESSYVFALEDVVRDGIYYRDMITAVKLGLIHPDGQGKVYPAKAVTREEIAVILNNVLSLKGTPLYAYSTSLIEGYSDYYQIPDALKGIAASLAGTGILSGSNGRLDLTRNASRAEAVTMVYRTLSAYGLLN